MSTIQNPNGYDIIFSPNIDASSPYPHEIESGSVQVAPTTIARLTIGADIVITSSGPTLVTGTKIIPYQLSPLTDGQVYVATHIDTTHFSLQGTGSTGGSSTFSNAATGKYITLYDSVSGDNSFWLKLPTLSHTTDEQFYIFYNQAGVTVSPENPTGVWNSNSTTSVYHFPYAYPFIQNPDSLTTHNLSQESNVLTSAAGLIERGIYGQSSGGDGLRNSSYVNVPSTAWTVCGWINSIKTQGAPVATFSLGGNDGIRFLATNLGSALGPQLLFINAP